MGRYISIERQMSGVRYVCRHGIGNEIFFATIEKKFRDRFAETCATRENPEACPFLLKDDDGSQLCAIYQTRPDFCQRFICCTMRIFDQSGREIGKIKGKVSISTNDPRLKEVWECVTPETAADDDAAWRRAAAEALEKEGYLAEIYE